MHTKVYKSLDQSGLSDLMRVNILASRSLPLLLRNLTCTVQYRTVQNSTAQYSTVQLALAPQEADLVVQEVVGEEGVRHLHTLPPVDLLVLRHALLAGDGPGE